MLRRRGLPFALLIVGCGGRTQLDISDFVDASVARDATVDATEQDLGRADAKDAKADADASADADVDALADANAEAGAGDSGPVNLWQALGGPWEHASFNSVAFDGSNVILTGNPGPVFRSSDGAAHFEIWPDDFARMRALNARGIALSRGKAVVSSVLGVFSANAAGGSFARILEPWSWTPSPETSGYGGFAVTSSGVWITTTAVHGTTGVVRRSLDGGLTWSAQTGFAESFFVRADGENVYLGEDGSGRVQRSFDGGATFTPIHTGFGRVMDAVATNTHLISAKDNALVVQPLAGGPPRDVARFDTIASLFRGLVRDGDLVVAPSPNGTYRSTDGGATWTLIPGARVNDGAAGVAASGALFVPAYRQGLQRSTDGGLSWKASSRGAQATWTWQVLPHPTAPSTLYAIEHDGFRLVRSVNDGLDWTEVRSSDCKDVAFSGGAMLVLGDGNVLRSKDDGATFDPVFSYVGAPEPMMVTSGSVVLINSGKGFARSTDGGLTWTEYSSPVLDRRLAVGPGGTLFLANVFDGVMRSTDGGLTWKHSTTPMAWPSEVAIGPDGTAWAFASGSGKLLRSADGGETWSVEPSPPEAVDYGDIRLGFTPAGDLLVPGYRRDANGNKIFTLYRRTAGGALERWDDGLFTSAVWAYARAGDRLYAATHTGVFRLTK